MPAAVAALAEVWNNPDLPEPDGWQRAKDIDEPDFRRRPGCDRASEYRAP